jgi:SET domain-containing protein
MTGQASLTRARRTRPPGPAAAEFLADCRVRRSRIHGLGLFTCRAIGRRRKLGELSGELRRLPLARQQHQQREVIQLVEFSRRWALDLTRGNAFRHLNHSCQANCYLRVIRRRIEVYSRGAIPAGAELTVDYGETMHRGGMACMCGLPGCRARI